MDILEVAVVRYVIFFLYVVEGHELLSQSVTGLSVQAEKRKGLLLIRNMELCHNRGFIYKWEIFDAQFLN